MLTLASLCHSIGGRPGRASFADNGRRAELMLCLCFAIAFTAVSGKAIIYATSSNELPVLASASGPPALAKSRPDIVDRNGLLLATDIRVYWLAANPNDITNADDAAEKLTALFPDLDQAALAKKFRDKSSHFEWVKRGLTPNDAKAVQALGIPGLTLLTTVGRAYPQTKMPRRSLA